jgi:hypothetical protein
MATYTEAPSLSALQQLLDLARAHPVTSEEALPFALAWLAAPRLIENRRLVGVDRLQDFLQEATWDQLSSYIGDPDQRFLRGSLPPKSTESVNAEAYSIVSGLASASGVSGWNLVDAAWALSGQYRRSLYDLWAYHPELCDLSVNMLHASKQDTVWIPFDTTGQLTIRAARTGAQVVLSSASSYSTTLVRLLLELEDDQSARERVKICTPDQLREAFLGGGPTHCLAAAPLGARVEQLRYVSAFEQLPKYRDLSVKGSDFNRSEPWAIATIWPVVRECGVFIVSPSLLFGQGQEVRLRQALIRGKEGNQVSQIYALPSGMMSATNIPTCLLALNRYTDTATIVMKDLTGQTIDNRPQFRFGRDINAAQAQELGVDVPVPPSVYTIVTTDECAAAEYSLLPGRYTRRATNLGGQRKLLRELLAIDALRSPLPTKDPLATSMWEVGIPLLDRWRPIDSGYERWMRISARRRYDHQLQRDDIVVSIKGTIGKVGIIGGSSQGTDPASLFHSAQDLLENLADAPPSGNAAVPSSSCIALRANDQVVLPQYLFLYLRSNDFKRQLEALRVGAAIAHVTPASLLSGILVPVPPLSEQATIVTKYGELMRLEEEIEDIQLRMKDVQEGMF